MNKEPYILYLRDKHPLIEQVELILRESGYNVVGAASYEQGLALIRQRKPDVLLLDLTQPGGMSWELFQKVKSDRTLAGIPIIDVSARVPEAGRILIENHPPPPFDLDRLVRSVMVLARKRRGLPEPMVH